MPAGSECVRGHSRQNTVPSGVGRKACGTERVTSPAPLPGALRGAPQEGVDGDAEAAPAQGKAFPKPHNVPVMFTLWQAQTIDICVNNLRNFARPVQHNSGIATIARNPGRACSRTPLRIHRFLSIWLSKIGLGISHRANGGFARSDGEGGAWCGLRQVDDFRVVHLRRFGGDGSDWP